MFINIIVFGQMGMFHVMKFSKNWRKLLWKEMFRRAIRYTDIR